MAKWTKRLHDIDSAKAAKLLAQREKEQEENKKFLIKYRVLLPMVLRVLKDFAKEVYGSSLFGMYDHFSIEECPSGVLNSSKPAWIIRNKDSLQCREDYIVELCKYSRTFYFHITHGNSKIGSRDDSEEKLKEALIDLYAKRHGSV